MKSIYILVIVVILSLGAENAFADDPFAGPGTSSMGEVQVDGIEDNHTIDGGIIIPPPYNSSIGDYIWLDINRNGIQDEENTGIPYVHVILWWKFGEGFVQYDDTFTDGLGYYIFEGLPAGTYGVQPEIEGRTPTIVHVNGSDYTNDSDLVS